MGVIHKGRPQDGVEVGSDLFTSLVSPELLQGFGYGLAGTAF